MENQKVYSLVEAKRIVELDLDKIFSQEVQERLFVELKKDLKMRYKTWDDYQASYWAIIMMRLEIAVTGPVTIEFDSEDDPNVITIIGKPDYGS